MRLGRLPVAIAVGALATACDASTSEPFVRRSFGFTFESDLGGWAADATDLDDPPVTWSIVRSDELAERGDWSVELFLDNENDAGKIWIERAFELTPGASYDVEVAFDLASADFGIVNRWRIIAGVSAENPEIADDLSFQDETGNGAEDDVGFVWLPKRYAFQNVEADPDTGVLWVSIGVWGTFETPRTYFIDDVELIFTRR